MLHWRMTISAQQKKYLSGALVGLASGLLLYALKEVVPSLPLVYQGLGVVVVTSAAHVVDALGHTQRVEEAIAAAKPKAE